MWDSLVPEDRASYNECSTPPPGDRDTVLVDPVGAVMVGGENFGSHGVSAFLSSQSKAMGFPSASGSQDQTHGGEGQ